MSDPRLMKLYDEYDQALDDLITAGEKLPNRHEQTNLTPLQQRVSDAIWRVVDMEERLREGNTK